MLARAAYDVLVSFAGTMLGLGVGVLIIAAWPQRR